MRESDWDFGADRCPDGADPWPDCVRLGPLLTAFFDHEVGLEEGAAARAHLAKCTACALAYGHWDQTRYLLQRLPVANVPVGLLTRILLLCRLSLLKRRPTLPAQLYSPQWRETIDWGPLAARGSSRSRTAASATASDTPVYADTSVDADGGAVPVPGDLREQILRRTVGLPPVAPAAAARARRWEPIVLSRRANTFMAAAAVPAFALLVAANLTKPMVVLSLPAVVQSALPGHENVREVIRPTIIVPTPVSMPVASQAPEQDSWDDAILDAPANLPAVARRALAENSQQPVARTVAFEPLPDRARVQRIALPQVAAISSRPQAALAWARRAGTVSQARSAAPGRAATSMVAGEGDVLDNLNLPSVSSLPLTLASWTPRHNDVAASRVALRTSAGDNGNSASGSDDALDAVSAIRDQRPDSVRQVLDDYRAALMTEDSSEPAAQDSNDNADVNE